MTTLISLGNSSKCQHRHKNTAVVLEYFIHKFSDFCFFFFLKQLLPLNSQIAVYAAATFKNSTMNEALEYSYLIFFWNFFSSFHKIRAENHK